MYSYHWVLLQNNDHSVVDKNFLGWCEHNADDKSTRMQLVHSYVRYSTSCITKTRRPLLDIKRHLNSCETESKALLLKHSSSCCTYSLTSLSSSQETKLKTRKLKVATLILPPPPKVYWNREQKTSSRDGGHFAVS